MGYITAASLYYKPVMLDNEVKIMRYFTWVNFAVFLMVKKYLQKTVHLLVCNEVIFPANSSTFTSSIFAYFGSQLHYKLLDAIKLQTEVCP